MDLQQIIVSDSQINFVGGSIAERYHRCLAVNDPEGARQALQLARHLPGYRNESLIWQGLDDLRKGSLHAAFVHLAAAAEKMPKAASVHALLVRLLQQKSPDLALKLLEGVMQFNPTDPALRATRWALLSSALPPESLRQMLLAELPDIDQADELKQVLPLLARSACLQVGVVRHDVQSQQLTGWALDLANPGRVVELELNTGTHSAICLADQADPLLQAAGQSAEQGGFRISMACTEQPVHIRFRDGAPLCGSPLVLLPPITLTSTRAQLPQAGDEQIVDILLPVYGGVEATLTCIDSVLAAVKHNQTPHRLIVLDDASPEPAIVERLELLAAQGLLQHIRRPANLGFIRNINRGMALNPGRDVVWLNADTRVHGNWIDRLRAAAYSMSDIASVTPFSNNAELMSFPVMRYSHPMPDANALAELDALASRLTDHSPVELEFGCGFCLYIKRAAIEQVGYLDEIGLKRGYGEETDWCLRASEAGWRHVAAVDVFVAHQGGCSFGAEKPLRVAQNNAVLRRRYPDAERRFNAYVARDPLEPYRRQLAESIRQHSHSAAARWLEQALQAHRQEQEKLPGSSCHLRASSPNQTLASQPVRVHTPADLPEHQCFLIADALTASPGLARRWVAFARQLAREGRDTILLLDQSTPWETELCSTGRVFNLPGLKGLNHDQTLVACGHPPALMLV